MLSKLGAMLDPAERKALTLVAFAASCLCFAPREVVSGTFLLLVSFLLWRWDQKLLHREEAAEQPSNDPNVS